MTALPLDGVRIVDLTLVWAGTFATVLLADLGAEVIKVENPFLMQPMTRGAAHPPSGIVERVAYPNGRLGPRPWNYTSTFVQMYRNKKSFTVDLRRPEGLEILGRLIAKSDVLIENNAAGTMEKLGITEAWLRAITANIIFVRAPAYGSSGPYVDARALGVHLESVIGHTLLRGYPDLGPTATTSVYAGDYMAGALGALAVMMALWHRRRTGRGQLVELAQAEGSSALVAQALMDFAINGHVQTAAGNRSPDAAPAGVYPCRSPGPPEKGDDRWIAITVGSDDEWRALRRELGEPAWAQASDLDTLAGRIAQHDAIDEHLAAWTRGFDDYPLFHRLQAAGIAAAPVLAAPRVRDDPHVQARNLWAPQDLYDAIGTFHYANPFYRFPETPVTVRQPPVAMGEHNEYVYKEVIGVSDEEYQRLVAAGHISMDFDASVP